MGSTVSQKFSDVSAVLAASIIQVVSERIKALTITKIILKFQIISDQDYFMYLYVLRQ
jgi:hypothetical protein